MRIHILGICGTFMSGIALIAKQAGHEVTGSDRHVYPPINNQLAAHGISFIENYNPEQITKEIDCVIVGNVISRGNPALEKVLVEKIPYISGPQWLYENVLKNYWVLGVAGTHGKTTTASLLAWILETAGLNPGFLIGGIPENFTASARCTASPYFVIEADEYDSAFFDKRSKFIHYHPQTLILNNLEYDHADIFPNLESIKQQFHYLIKTIPSNGSIIHSAHDENLLTILEKGCWTPRCTFSANEDEGEWQAKLTNPEGSAFYVLYQGKKIGEVNWSLIGKHNVENALAAIAGAFSINIPIEETLSALSSFKNVKRRLEVKSGIKDIIIYDDFAHHPTAIATTLAGLRAKIGRKSRMIAVIEFGSYSMRQGILKEKIKAACETADMVICKNPSREWGLKNILNTFSQPTALFEETDTLIAELVPQLKAGDHVVIMSNTGFDNIYQKLISAIEKPAVSI